MIDWFVVLAPLAFLPIALLVFVSCPMDFDALAPVPVILRYDPGSETNVESIEVTFEFGAISSTRTLFNQDSVPDGGEIIDPAGGEIQDFGVILLSDEGVVECECLITMMGPLQPQFEADTAIKEEEEDLQGRFELSRDGDSFSVAFAKQG